MPGRVHGEGLGLMLGSPTDSGVLWQSRPFRVISFFFQALRCQRPAKSVGHICGGEKTEKEVNCVAGREQRMDRF